MNIAPYRFTKPKRPVKKVFIHCSASDNPEHDNVATIDAWHRANGWSGIGYHLFIRKSGLIEIGRDLEKTPAAQAPYNADTIAICLHGLVRDKFTPAQIATLVSLCYQIDAAYFQHRLTFHGHCEVAAKACPVIAYRDVLGLSKDGYLPVGDVAVTKKQLMQVGVGGFEGIELPDTAKIATGTLKLGDKGGGVETLQKNLAELNYFPGAIDGVYGPRTRDSVMAFQADHHLVTDGKFGPASREAMLRAPTKRPVAGARAIASLASLAASGSTVAKVSRDTQLVGGALSIGGVLAAVNQTTGILSKLADATGPLGDIVAGLAPWQGGVLAAVGAFVLIRSMAGGRAHVADFRSGKNA